MEKEGVSENPDNRTDVSPTTKPHLIEVVVGTQGILIGTPLGSKPRVLNRRFDHSLFFLSVVARFNPDLLPLIVAGLFLDAVHCFEFLN